MISIICPKCKTENPAQAIFCRHCGYQFRQSVADSQKTEKYNELKRDVEDARLQQEKLLRELEVSKRVLEEAKRQIHFAVIKAEKEEKTWWIISVIALIVSAIIFICTGTGTIDIIIAFVELIIAALIYFLEISK